MSEKRLDARPRHWCSWIANPYCYRCPRSERTGEACWCSHLPPFDWPWRVIPPLVTDPDIQGWIYDEYGPHPAPKAEPVVRRGRGRPRKGSK